MDVILGQVLLSKTFDITVSIRFFNLIYVFIATLNNIYSFFSRGKNALMFVKHYNKQ